MIAKKQPKTEPATDRDYYARYNKAKTELEEWKAKKAELDYNYSCGRYLSREDVSKSSAVILANLAQVLRNLPDYLERKVGIEPATVLAIQEAVDKSLGEVAESLRKIHES